MATRYENLSGVDSNYIDGTFASLSQVTAGQSMLLLGSAEKGLSNTPYLVQDIGAVVAEFGKDSPVTTLAAQVADTTDANVLIARVGGKQSHFILEKEIADSDEKEIVLRIAPVERGDFSVFSKYKVALTPYESNNLVRQRVVIFDAETEVVRYDSEEILSTDDSLFEIELGGAVGELFVTNTTSYLAPTSLAQVQAQAAQDIRSLVTVSELPSLQELLALATGDLDSKIDRFDDVYAVAFPASGFTGISANSKDGSASINMTQCERFAAIESAYADLEDAGIDFMYCDGCYADTKSIPASGLTSSEFARWDDLYLGSAHKSVVAGRPHLTMFASPDPLSSDHVVNAAVTITPTVTAGSIGDFSVEVKQEALDLGLLLTLNDVRISHGATSGVEEYFDVDGRIKCNVSANITATTDSTVINGEVFSAGTLTISGFTISSKSFTFGVQPKVIDLNGSTVANLPGTIEKFTTDVEASLDLRKLFVLNGDSAGDHSIDNAVLTHFDLTGELVPDEVYDSLIDASGATYKLHEDAYAREVNFAHQAGSMAYTSSTEYKATMAVVPTTRARGGLRQLARWAGKAPEYAIASDGSLVVSKNGSGFMGTEVLYGSTTYRPTDSGVGGAYGGLIQTNKGFGIDPTDELLDSRGIAVDLGKHVIVVGAYGVVSIAGVSRTPSFVVDNLGPKIIQKIMQMPVNEEPIGPINGLIEGVSTTGAINSRALLNDLALGRVTMIGSDGALASIRTAALPSSDYARISTVRAANLVCDAMRNVSLRYLGKSFSDAQLAALDAELAGTMRSLKVDGSIQDGSVQVSASRVDRINGRLNLKVQFVPPLSIEAITIDLTVSAPQA